MSDKYDDDSMINVKVDGGMSINEYIKVEAYKLAVSEGHTTYQDVQSRINYHLNRLKLLVSTNRIY